MKSNGPPYFWHTSCTKKSDQLSKYELPDKRIYAYPAVEYIDNLTERMREQTRECYRAAVEAGKFIVFVKDNARKTLRSYIFDVPGEPASASQETVPLQVV